MTPECVSAFSASASPASTVLTGCRGPWATVLPTNSAINARSATPSPETLPPPSSSGTNRLAQPNSAARCHQSASNETPAECNSRTLLSEASFSRKACAVDANNNRSGESAVVVMLLASLFEIGPVAVASAPVATTSTLATVGRFSGQDERRHVWLVDDLVGHLEQVDHVAAHHLSDALLVEAVALEVVDQVDRVGQSFGMRPVRAEHDAVD